MTITPSVIFALNALALAVAGLRWVALGFCIFSVLLAIAATAALPQDDA